jgi:hypothetical protein
MSSTSLTDRNSSPGTTSDTTLTDRVSIAATSTQVYIIEDNFDESSQIRLDFHVPDIGSSWTKLSTSTLGIDVIANSSYAKAVGEHHGDGGSTTVTADGLNRFNTASLLSTHVFATTDYTYDVIAKFINSSTYGSNPVVFWGVGGGRDASTSFAGGWQFNWAGYNQSWILSDVDSSTSVTVPQAWPGDPTWMKLEVRTTGAVGLYSTDGVTYNEVASFDSTWRSTTVPHAQLSMSNFTDQSDPPDIEYFAVITT